MTITSTKFDKKPTKAAFTLIELLVVVTIMLILMGLLLGVMQYARQKAMKSRAKADILQIQNAIEEFKMSRGYYPPDLTYVTNSLAQNIFINNDPWQRPYDYELLTPLTYRLRCEGPRADIDEDDIIPRD